MKTKNNKIITTQDGSFSLKSLFFDETYHSINGASSESMHVFINSGFNQISKDEISVFEVGFGTGLNAILTFNEAQKNRKNVNYISIEKFPIDFDIAKKLNYDILTDNNEVFFKLHSCKWNKQHEISDFFTFTKIQADFTSFLFTKKFDVFYFDAFSYDTQPEMWSSIIFEKIYDATNKNGILVTYSSKGIVKQNLRSVGFLVKRLKGFKKRHILRATKDGKNKDVT